MRLAAWGALLVGWSACSDAAIAPAQALLITVLEAPRPDRVQARFTAAIESEPLELTGRSNGGLIVDGDRARLELQAPMGGTAATLALGDGGLAVGLPGRRRHLTSTHAERALQAASGGRLDGRSLIAVLRGQVPADSGQVQSAVAVDGGYRVTMGGSTGLTIEAVLDEACGCATNVALRDIRGSAVMSADFGPRELVEGEAVPDFVTLRVPGLDLRAHLAYSHWAHADTPIADPLAAPAGFVAAPLQPVVDRWAQGAARRWAAAQDLTTTP